MCSFFVLVQAYMMILIDWIVVLSYTSWILFYLNKLDVYLCLLLDIMHIDINMHKYLNDPNKHSWV